MATNFECTKCQTLFSDNPPCVPTILPSCSHSVCRGCLASTHKCPVAQCQVPVSWQDREVATTNYLLLGRVGVEKLSENVSSFETTMRSAACIPYCDSKNFCYDENNGESTFHTLSDKDQVFEVADAISIEIQIEKTGSFLLAQLRKMKTEVEGEQKFDEYRMKKLTNYVVNCHRELDLLMDRIRKLHREREGLNKNIELFDVSNKEEIIYAENGPMTSPEEFVDGELSDDTRKHVINEVDEYVEKKSELMSSSSVGKLVNMITDDEESTFAGDDYRISTEDDTEIPPSDSEPTNEEATVGWNHEYSKLEMFEELELVVVILVESPSSFFVMKVVDIPTAEELELTLNELKSRNTTPKEAEEGQLVAVEIRNTTTRGRVTYIGNNEATVTYIDLGGTGQHPLSSLTVLPNDLSTIPGLAHQCALADISSPTSLAWSDEATTCLEQATNQKHCLVSLQDFQGSGKPLLVTLYLKPGEGVPRVNSCCLAEVLVYKELAIWNSEERIHSQENKYVKGYLKLAPVRQGAEHKVVVTHVISPAHLFVQFVGGKGSYKEISRKLFVDLDTEYRRRAGESGLAVLAPRVGMACIAQWSGDSKYYRARVVSVLREGKVRVQFVDFGNEEIVFDRKLLKITDEFLNTPILATSVSLAEIVPVQGNVWGESAISEFANRTRDRELVMYVEEEMTFDTPCKILLYERLPDRDVCVNARLVREGYAMSLSGVCMTTDYPKDVLEVDEEVDDDVQGKGAHGLCGDKNPEKVACRVINVLSPSSVYIRQVTDEESFLQLTSDLQSYYSSRPATDVITRVGSLCAARLGVQEGWARARVIRVKGFKVELKLMDSGNMVTLPVQSLRPLANSFRFRNFVDEVHLADLLPTGGTGKWSTTACDMLKELLEQYDMMIFVDIVGKSLHGTVPVKIFVKQIRGSEYEFVSVEEKLVDAGMAIPALNRLSCRQVPSVKPADKKIGFSQDSPIISRGKSSDLEHNPAVSWLPAVLPTASQEFLAVATHVDWECNIYLLPEGVSQDTLRIIGNVLDSKFQGSSPRPVDRYWRVGELAIARWDLDCKWYRAKVLGVDVNLGMCTVEYVDYGTVEECMMEDMRKDLFMTEIPIQCFPLQMNSVKPVGDSWEQSVLDFLHSNIVDQTLKVRMTVTPIKDKVKEGTRTKIGMGSLITRAGLDVGDLLVRNGYATRCEY